MILLLDEIIEFYAEKFLNDEVAKTKKLTFAQYLESQMSKI